MSWDFVAASPIVSACSMAPFISNASYIFSDGRNDLKLLTTGAFVKAPLSSCISAVTSNVPAGRTTWKLSLGPE